MKILVPFLMLFSISSAFLTNGLIDLPSVIPSIPSLGVIQATGLSLADKDDLLSQILSKLILDEDTINIVKNFLETILGGELVKCTQEVSEEEISENCIGINGLNGAIDKWVQAAENNIEYAHIIKPFGLALKYFAKDAFEDVDNDRRVLYCSMYNVVLPLLYVGSLSLDSVPEPIYELIYKPNASSSAANDLEEIKEYGQIFKEYITAKVNAELNGKPQYMCCSNKSCIIGKALVAMATDMIINKEFAKYKIVCATLLLIASLMNHFIHNIVKQLNLNI